MVLSKIFFWLIFFLNFGNITQKTEELQSVKLNSLEGNSVIVNVKLDDVNDKITLMLKPTRIISISGYRGLLSDIKIINHNFIYLSFYIRGGSGVKLVRTTLVCVAEGKLYKSMDLISMQSYVFKNTYNQKVDSMGLYDDSGIYHISFLDSKYDKNNEYKLKAIQYEKIKSKYAPNKNQETSDTLCFSFDVNSRVFYNQYKTLKESYIISEKPQLMKGQKYYSIKLKNDEYFYIDKIWYTKNNGNRLTEFF